MRWTRARIGIAMLGLSALGASHGAWGQRARLPEECRTPELRQCVAAGREGMRECVTRVLPSLPDTCRKPISERAAARGGALPASTRELSYGADARQALDLTPVPGVGKAPLLFFVHGGGWAIGDKRGAAGEKAGFATGQGYAFASANYRLVPQARVEDQLADLAAAIAFARAQPGVDPDRIVLMGHSAGAHLAAMLGSDPTWLAQAKVPMASIRGVVLLDGAGYDVGKQIADAGNRARGMYDQAFGSDPRRHAALSPLTHAAAPNAARWLILPVASRPDSNAQSKALADALRRAGAAVTLSPQPGKTHASLNRELGRAGDPATAEVARFLTAVR